MNERVQVVVIGAGLAGSAAALALARGGAKVVVLERRSEGELGHLPGGWISGAVVSKLFSNWRQEIPIERRVVEQRLSLLTQDGAVWIDHSDRSEGEKPASVFTMRRDRFDPWMLQKVREAGAELRLGVDVSGVSYNAVVGRTQVVHSTGRIDCTVAVIATGIDALLRPNSRGRPQPHLTGLHETLEGEAGLIDRRFGAKGDRGVVMRFVLGFLGAEERGLGYLATYRNGIGSGVVLQTPPTVDRESRVREVLEQFKGHWVVAPFLRNLEKVGESVQRIPTHFSAGRLYAPGQLFAGDGGGLHGWSGAWTSGWSTALRSGRAAGAAALEAVRTNDGSEARLEAYVTHLREDGVIRDTRRGLRAMNGLWFDHRLHRTYPRAFSDLLHRMMTETGAPKEPIAKAARSVFRAQGVRAIGLLRDANRLGKGA